MATTTTTKKSGNKSEVAPYVDNINGYITVRQAAELASTPELNKIRDVEKCEQSTINYWLREGDIKGVYLDDSVLLVLKSSLEEYLQELPKIEAERKRLKHERDEIKRLEDELRNEQKRKREELEQRKKALKKN